MLSRICHPSVIGYSIWILYALVPLALRIQYRMRDSTTPLVSPNPMAIHSLFSTVMALSIPVQYMVKPPDTPERRELMERDSSGIYRVGAQAKKRYEPERAIGWKDVVEVALIVGAHRI